MLSNKLYSPKWVSEIVSAHYAQSLSLTIMYSSTEFDFTLQLVGQEMIGMSTFSNTSLLFHHVGVKLILRLHLRRQGEVS